MAVDARRGAASGGARTHEGTTRRDGIDERRDAMISRETTEIKWSTGWARKLDFYVSERRRASLAMGAITGSCPFGAQ